MSYPLTVSQAIREQYRRLKMRGDTPKRVYIGYDTLYTLKEEANRLIDMGPFNEPPTFEGMEIVQVDKDSWLDVTT